MLHFRTERVLLVAPNIFSVQLLAKNKQIKHITSVDRVFPAIYEVAPHMVIFDYDYLDKDMEKKPDDARLAQDVTEEKP